MSGMEVTTQTGLAQKGAGFELLKEALPGLRWRSLLQAVISCSITGIVKNLGIKGQHSGNIRYSVTSAVDRPASGRQSESYPVPTLLIFAHFLGNHRCNCSSETGLCTRRS